MFGIRDGREKERDCGIIGKGTHGIRETFTGYGYATRKAGFAKILAREAGLGKKTVFGIAMRDVRDPGWS